MVIFSSLHHKTPLLTAKSALAPIFPQKMTLNQYFYGNSKTHKPIGIASRKRDISIILSSNEPALTLSRQRIIRSQLSPLDGSAKWPRTILFYLSYLPANLQCMIQKHMFLAESTEMLKPRCVNLSPDPQSQMERPAGLFMKV